MQNSYTRWGFIVSNHTYTREGLDLFNCSITLETLQTVTNEQEAAMEMETLISMGVVPTFGRFINKINGGAFHWEQKPMGDEFVTATRVTFTYVSNRSELNQSEVEALLNRLYGDDWRTQLGVES